LRNERDCKAVEALDIFWETIVIVRLLLWRNTMIIHKFLLAQKGLDIFEKQ
jgi:hypothetical protein